MSEFQNELNSAVHMLDAVLSDIDKLLRDASPDDLDLADAVMCREILGGSAMKGGAAAVLAGIRERLDDLCGDALGSYENTVTGIGVVRRHERKNRVRWHKDELLHDVLDSRIVDENTGEIEAPIDKVLAVWNLGVPRTTALKARGLNADDYCDVEKRPGWQLEVI